MPGRTPRSRPARRRPRPAIHRRSASSECLHDSVTKPTTKEQLQPMTYSSALTRGVVVGALGLLVAGPAAAASLQPVSNWGASGVPSYISMYVYVPDKLAADPPILVVAHFCGGSASAVFGQAQGGGIVAAADKYGFIMIFPQTTNPATSAKCLDVGTRQSLTHDGGGDTQAVAQMVKYTIATYH